MNISVISFTKNGGKMAVLLRSLLKQHCFCCVIPERHMTKELEAGGIAGLKESLNQWAEREFHSSDAIIFIGAAGIAVRAVAPFVKDKKTDPAVLVIDEKGQYVIPLLSGHVGGANELALEIACAVEQNGGRTMLPVITTASDINHTFAPDIYGKQHGLLLESRAEAKEVAAAALEGEEIGFFDDFNRFPVPDGCVKGKKCRKNIWITASSKEAEAGCLKMIFPCVCLGMGCRKNMAPAVLEKKALEALEAAGISRKSVKSLASIDIKKEEKALSCLAEKWQIPFFTYSAEELLTAEGEFSASAFVTEVTGTDNVCERSACLGSRGGRLILKKRAGEGVTAALAMEVDE